MLFIQQKKTITWRVHYTTNVCYFEMIPHMIAHYIEDKALYNYCTSKP